MARRSVLTGLLAVFALTAGSVAAQDEEHLFDRNRPDGFGPPGVAGHFTLDAGELLWNFTYSREEMLGNRIGTQPISQAELLDVFPVAPLSMLSQTLDLELRYGLTDRLTLAASMPFIYRDDTNAVDEASFIGNFTVTSVFGSFTNDIGDVKVSTLWNVLDSGPHVLSLGIGASIPTGEIDERGRTATSERAQLPFNMQTGSGSWEVLPSLSFMTQNEFGTFGAQISSTFHVNDNDRGYKLGDRFDMTAWVSYNVMDEWISLSARVVREEWGSVAGLDPETNTLEDPRADPFATGGTLVQLPIGFTLYVREGALEGHRFSVEYFQPVHQDLNGPQLQVDNVVTIGWQVAF